MAIDEQGKPLPDELKIDNISNWEQMFQIPDEDLYQDWELKDRDVERELFYKVCVIGDWKLIRRKDG